MAKAKARRLTGNFTLGGEQAEADPLLRSGGFFASGHYLAVESRTDPRCFVIGRTGSGKSAMLQQLEVEGQHVIRITPEDLALPYITDLQAVQYLAALGVHLDPLFIALWKHVLLIEIIKDRYKVDSADAKQNFIHGLRDKIKRDRSKTAALDYLEEFEGKFWCETDERVKDITRRFEEQVEAEAGGKVSLTHLGEVSGRAGGSRAMSVETRGNQADRFQRIVNETQLPRLNKMMAVLDEDILDSGQHYTYVIVDDLDRDWVDEQVVNSLVRCLFRAVVDLKRVQNLKVLVALRTNIFEHLDFGSRTGGQEEKFRALTLRVRWAKSDIEAMLSERTRAAGQLHNLPELTSIKDLLPATNRTRGNPLEFILRRTLLRPRDAIAYINEALAISGKPKLSWDDIHRAERPYSTKRLLALRDEWKPSFPGVGRVLENFERAPVLMDRADLAERLDATALLVADRDFEGATWLTPLAQEVWDAVEGTAWAEVYFPLAQLLYRIGFLGCRVAETKRLLFAHDEPDYLEQVTALDRADFFSVHPAFRQALEIHHDRELDVATD